MLSREGKRSTLTHPLLGVSGVEGWVYSKFFVSMVGRRAATAPVFEYTVGYRGPEWSWPRGGLR
jgi:hypothetical protein